MRIVAALIAGLAVSACNQAESVDVTTDIRCLLILGQLVRAQANDPVAQTKSIEVAHFYLGRIEGRDPTIDLKGRMKAEAENMTTELIRSSAGVCAAHQKANSQKFRDISKEFGEMARM